MFSERRLYKHSVGYIKEKVYLETQQTKSDPRQVDIISYDNGLQASLSVSLFPLRPMDTKYQFIGHQSETAAITI